MVLPGAARPRIDERADMGPGCDRHGAGCRDGFGWRHGCRRKVELINEGTRVTSVRTTNADGEYLFNFVPPGRYTVTASLTGFKMVNTSGVDVAVNKTTRVNLTLEVGAVTESVQVTADAVRID